MSYGRIGPKTEGGQGGKVGHGNMTHWDYTEVIKECCRRVRRRMLKREAERQLAEWEEERQAA